MKKVVYGSLLILIMIGAIFFFRDPFFQIKSIQFQDQNYISDKQLKEGFEPLNGKNFVVVFWKLRFKTRYLNQFVVAKDFVFNMKIPASLTIRVVEKEPWVSFVSSKHHYIIAHDGTILNRKQSKYRIKDPHKMIIIKGVAKDAFTGERIPIDILKKTQIITAHVTRYFLASNLQIIFKKFDQIELLHDDTLPIKIGALEAIAEKFERLNMFLDHIKNQKTTDEIDYIDLRFPGKVVVKYGS